MAVGALLVLAGLGFCGMYVVEAFWMRVGEADQSLLFWYLPILFIGILSFMAGLGLLALSRHRRRRPPNDKSG